MVDHPENFPVASWLLPRAMRPHVANIYWFARTADDFADEPGREPAERLRLLDEWGQKLRGDAFPDLSRTRRQFALSMEPFEDLLSAFRQDVTRTRYETWDEVYDYCRRSANPVGRLVLRLFGYSSPELDGYSDAVCTALQLTNFWQDLAIDWRRGRLYVPAEEWRAAGAIPTDLDHGEMTPAWRTAMKRAVERTRALFDHGRPICDAVHGRLRYELRATWLGGMRILERLERVRYDVFSHRPKLTKRDGLVIAWGVVHWRS